MAGTVSWMSASRITTASIQPPRKPARRPSRHAGRQRQHDGGEPDHQRHPAAVEDGRQHVAPLVVGAQQMAGAGRGEGIHQVQGLQVEGIERRHPRREQGAEK